MSANPSRIGLKIVVVLVVLAGAAAAAVFAFRPVATVSVVKPGPIRNIVAGTVVVSAEKISEIKSEAEGRLIESQLLADNDVKEDEKLAQIDTSALDIEIKHYESELAAAKDNIRVNVTVAELGWKSADEDFKLAQRRHEENSLSDVDFIKIERAHQSAVQSRELTTVDNAQKVENLEHKLATLRLQKAKATVKAPFSGVIAQVFANKGDLINNKQALATVITRTRLVTGKIAEENFAAIAVGQECTVKFLVYGDELFRAKVSKKLPTAEEATQRYLVYLDVDIKPERLLPNLTGDVGITVGQHEAQALVPKRAVFDGRFVKVVENGRVRQREVELGFASLTIAEITKGLAAGDQVIVEGQDLFAEGDRVRTESAK